MSKATARPWRRDGTHVMGSDNQPVAVCRQARPRNTMIALANAALIVKAVDCHDDLLDACKQVQAWLRSRPLDKNPMGLADVVDYAIAKAAEERW